MSNNYGNAIFTIEKGYNGEYSFNSVEPLSFQTAYSGFVGTNASKPSIFYPGTAEAQPIFEYLLSPTLPMYLLPFITTVTNGPDYIPNSFGRLECWNPNYYLYYEKLVVTCLVAPLQEIALYFMNGYYLPDGNFQYPQDNATFQTRIPLVGAQPGDQITIDFPHPVRNVPDSSFNLGLPQTYNSYIAATVMLGDPYKIRNGLIAVSAPAGAPSVQATGTSIGAWHVEAIGFRAPRSYNTGG